MNIFQGSTSLSDYLAQCETSLNDEIKNENKNYLLNADETSYIDYLVNKYNIEPLEFNYPNIYISEGDHKKPEFLNMNQLTYYPTTPSVYSPTQTSEKMLLAYHLPFSGLHILLNMRPSNFISWTCKERFSPATDELIIEKLIDTSTNPENINAEIEKVIENIKIQVNHSTTEVNKYNESLPEKAQKSLNSRKTEILQLIGTLKKLNVPIKKSNESQEIVPIRKKKLSVRALFGRVSKILLNTLPRFRVRTSKIKKLTFHAV